MNFLHQEAGQGKWQTLSLSEQLGNIGSEVGRAAQAEGKNKERFSGAAFRALDLFDLTLADARWKGRRIEIARVREVFCDIVFGEKQYKTSLRDLEKYFLPFALLARRKFGSNK